MSEVNGVASDVLRTQGKEADLAELVASEISAMDIAIEEAAKKIEELLEASRQNDSGAKLEVNEKVLDSCTALVRAIKELVNKSKALQKEIITERGVEVSDREYYKMNSRWTEGLISAAKAVGLGAKLLVDAADRSVTRKYFISKPWLTEISCPAGGRKSKLKGTLGCTGRMVILACMTYLLGYVSIMHRYNELSSWPVEGKFVKLGLICACYLSLLLFRHSPVVVKIGRAHV